LSRHAARLRQSMLISHSIPGKSFATCENIH
jgi:hypothetical protein